MGEDWESAAETMDTMFVEMRVEIRRIRYEMESADGMKIVKAEIREFSMRICNSLHNRWLRRSSEYW